LLREANSRSKKKVPTRLIIAILEAKNYKEAKRIIASIGKSKGGGKSSSSASTPEPPRVSNGDGAAKEGSDSDSDDEFLVNHNMYVKSQPLCYARDPFKQKQIFFNSVLRLTMLITECRSLCSKLSFDIIVEWVTVF